MMQLIASTNEKNLSKLAFDLECLDGAAAAVAEEAKWCRYPASADAGLLAVEPFAMETFGRLGPGALK
eukprot:8952568-Karenia_brevis.AAC.1